MITKSEQKRLEDYFDVKFTNPWPGGYIVYQDNLFVVAVPEECTFGQVRNLLSHTVDRNMLARNIVAMMFWRWRAALKRYAQHTGSPEYKAIVSEIENQAHNDFTACYNAYYGKWD